MILEHFYVFSHIGGDGLERYAYSTNRKFNEI